MKKILHIQVLPKMSGVQNISYEILKSLPAADFDRTIMFSKEGTDDQLDYIKTVFNAIGVKVVFSDYLFREINIKQDWLALKEIKDFCKKEKFDIVHTNSSKPGVVGRIAATLAGVPLVIHTVHGTAWNKFVKFPKWQFYWLCEMFASFFCDKIILVNKFYTRYFWLFKKKISTIYNAIDYSRFNGLKNEKKNDGKIRILFVGRLDTQKNPLGLLAAAKIVVAENPRAIFTFVGDGELFSACVNFINENDLERNVFMVGWQNAPGKFYAESDIFVSSSIYEAFGLMFLEAGYFGLPVCATNVEGIPEVIEDGVSGLLCNSDNVNTLAKNILLLCNDEKLRKKMGEENHRRALDVFSVKNMTEKYISIYNTTGGGVG